MKSKTSNPYFHILYWIFVAVIMILVFGRSWGNRMAAFYYISLLLPVVMSTSYFFNYFLVPRFLVKKKYFLFSLYFFYTLVISLYLEILVLTFSLLYLVNFKMSEMGHNSSDTLLLAVILYLIVFLSSFLLMAQQLSDSRKDLRKLTADKEKMQKAFLELTSNRKVARISFEEILFIESLADYIKVNTVHSEEIISKEKISTIEKRLPPIFMRIHRSFIVNTEKISRYTYNDVELGNLTLTIGRSYKKQVMQQLKTEKS